MEYICSGQPRPQTQGSHNVTLSCWQPPHPAHAAVICTCSALSQMAISMLSLGNQPVRPLTTNRRTHVVVQANSLSPISRKAMREQRRQQRQLKKDREAAASNPPPSSSAPVQRPTGGIQSVSYDILEAFFYGRAFAMTLNKRLSEAVVDTVAEISKQAAERPQKLQEFQDEVMQLARKEMAASSMPGLPGPASSSATGSGGSSNGSKQPAGPPPQQDLQAVVDDLRAEIAYSRAILQQIKTGGKSGTLPGPPPAIPTNAPASASSNGSGSV